MKTTAEGVHFSPCNAACLVLESAQAACRRSSFFFSEWAGVRNFFDGRASSIYVPHLRHALLFKRWVVIAHG
jgi:hypothetical protein